MTFNSEYIKEILEVARPYLRWIILGMYGLMFLYVNRIFIKDEKLRRWLLSSFEESSGKASGKSLTGFVFAKLIAFATLAAIVYSPNHLLPEYFLIALLTFVGGLYGIRLASKYFNGDDSNSNEPNSSEKKDDKCDLIGKPKDNNVQFNDEIG